MEKDSTLKLLLTVVVVLLLVTSGVYYYVYWSGGKRLKAPADLAQLALNANSEEERQRGARLLAEWAVVEGDDATRQAAVEQMRIVLKESKSPDVRASVIEGLGAVQDLQTGEELLVIVKDPTQNARLRDRAAVALGRILGYKYDFQPNGLDKTQQQRVIDQMEKDYKNRKKAPADS